MRTHGVHSSAGSPNVTTRQSYCVDQAWTGCDPIPPRVDRHANKKGQEERSAHIIPDSSTTTYYTTTVLVATFYYYLLAFLSLL